MGNLWPLLGERVATGFVFNNTNKIPTAWLAMSLRGEKKKKKDNLQF